MLAAKNFKKKPIVIMGANASGKTVLSIFLSKLIDGEIVSADSRQIYKHLRHGTSKPEGRWGNDSSGRNVYITEGVPYHLVDFLDPNYTYDVARYCEDFSKAIDGIAISGKTPIIAGGTGMYLNAVFNGLDPLPKPNPLYRKELMSMASEKGKKAVYEKLKEVDPVSAERIHPHNIHRVIRALEIYKANGKPSSQTLSGSFMRDITLFPGLFVYLKWDKNLLRERIRTRTENEFEQWANETRNLISSGYPHDCPGLKSLGYPIMIDYIEGKIKKNEAISTITTLSMEYAKRQNTWFSRYHNTIKIEFHSKDDFKISEIAHMISSEYSKI